ncbi:MAG TPA: SAM-dependent methyltransferase, partial [bacterium]|nr:SAM-dependent methyltransferase [bacterium]
ARVLSRGFVLLVDYGEDTPRLFGDARPDGSLRCFAGHAVHDDPLRFVGTQDITAHVDFGAVVAAARAAGFEAVAFLTQREWLDGWGVADAAAGIADLARAGKIRLDEVETNVNAIRWLRDPKGLGAAKVLALAKGVRPQPVPGLAGDVPAARRFRADDLPLTRLFDPFADLVE